MPRVDIDHLLNELGVDPAAPAPVRTPKGPERTEQPPAPASPRPDEAARPSPFNRLPPILQASTLEAPAAKPLPPRPVNTPPRPVLLTPANDTLSDIYQPEAHEESRPRTDLGQFLLSSGAVTAQQLTAAQTIMRQTPGRRLAEIAIEQGADEVGVQRAVAEFAGVAFERIDLEKGLEGGFDGKLLQRLSLDFCKQHMVVPLRIGEGGRVVIGATSTDDVFLADEVRRRLKVPAVKLVVVTAYDIRGALELVGVTQQQDVNISDLLGDVSETDVELERQETSSELNLEQQAGDGPVIRYVNYIIQTAITNNASDIHIEPTEKKLKVRFRIDGELFEMLQPPASYAAAITSRIKIMSNMDIAERRIPQNGRIRCTVGGQKLDLRVSTLPTACGEKTVMRLLRTSAINVELSDLGFDENTMEIWKNQIDLPHGIILVTGPTGSGKTTTLYASIRQLDKNSLNISTVEDPIEYHLDGITQTQTHEKIGMTFAEALRALLRQDPDVIMLGEIRDQETAHTAIQASLTGHLVLSTLHTNDAPSSITRLVNIGIEPFLVGAAINGVLAQRLVRRLCAHCKSQSLPTDERAEFLRMQGMDPDGVFVSVGCDRCRSTGYTGRVGIYELLSVDDQLRDIIARNPNVAEFRRLCIERGMVTLRDDGMRKVARGLTTVEEVLRVTEASM
ncbi:MAG: Flp pilus assembly complex ATPase component TadA [Phycisphaeraceae bacterium]|nr:Flp pilus assembly complex ATPase component TadA [Phycisphaeraceae bacterium]